MKNTSTRNHLVIRKGTFYILVHFTMYWNQWHLCLEGFKMSWIQSTYYVTLKVYLVVCRIWWLLCLCSHLLSPSISINLFLLTYTWVFSLLMRIYRPQYTDRVCCESPSSCTSFLSTSLLNVVGMNHCIPFNTAWSEVPIFTFGLRSLR